MLVLLLRVVSVLVFEVAGAAVDFCRLMSLFAVVGVRRLFCVAAIVVRRC